jgi:CubicO group peptidase (beta-lactamase class C family)
LDIDVPVQRYLPDFPEKEWPLTTRHLMGHVSGIRGFRGPEFIGRESCQDVTEGLAAFADDPLQFAPGSRFRRSSHGWVLVSAIVQAAAEEPFLDFMQREVFGALDMDLTTPELADTSAQNRARFYERRSFSTLRRSQPIDNSCRWAAEGFLSTPSDLVQFGLGMIDGEFLTSEIVETFWTPLQLESGRSRGYGLGWQVQSERLAEGVPATPVMSYRGSSIGSRASIMVFPEHGMVVAIAANTEENGIEELATSLAKLFAGDAEEEPGADPEAEADAGSDEEPAG